MWHQDFNRNFTKLRGYFVRKENNNIIYSAILLPELPSSAMRVLSTERKHRWLRWLHSGVHSKMAEDGNSGRRIVE